jgi:hypothetical protein
VFSVCYAGLFWDGVRRGRAHASVNLVVRWNGDEVPGAWKTCTYVLRDNIVGVWQYSCRSPCRQAHCERRARIGAALHFDRAIEHLDEAACDRQSEAGAAGIEADVPDVSIRGAGDIVDSTIKEAVIAIVGGPQAVAEAYGSATRCGPSIGGAASGAKSDSAIGSLHAADESFGVGEALCRAPGIEVREIGRPEAEQPEVRLSRDRFFS